MSTFETTTAPPSSGTAAATKPASVVGFFWSRVSDCADRIAMVDAAGPDPEGISWREYGARVRRLATALMVAGVREGDHVAVWSANRPEWHITSAAAMTVRARPVPVYRSLSADEAAHILSHSGAVVAVLDDVDVLEKLLSVRDRLPDLRRVVLVDGAIPEGMAGFVTSWAGTLEEGAAHLERLEAELDRRIAAVAPEDVATIIYTSGTAGPPKAVMATHANLVAAIDALSSSIVLSREDRVVSYLPLAHVVERLNSEVRQYVYGNTVWFVRSLPALPDTLRRVRPTFLFGVPRVWEKMAHTIEEGIDRQPRPRRWMVRGAVAVGRRAVDREQTGGRIGMALAAAHRLADRLVLSKIRVATGLDQAATLISGAAPIDSTLLRFYHAVGLRIREGYGMTENMACTTMNPAGPIRIGTVGTALAGIELRIAPDGEILMRGDTVFSGYYKDAQATADTVLDGWLHTGDVGAIDADGYLTITDRKKDLIVTAGGKNIAPTNIERLLKEHPLIEEAVVVGDRRPFLVALITLDRAELERLFARPGAAADAESLFDDAAVRAEIEKHVQAVNERLASVETVKRWAVLHEAFSVGGELTPTYKVRRRLVLDRYSQVLEGLYTARSAGASRQQ